MKFIPTKASAYFRLWAMAMIIGLAFGCKKDDHWPPNAKQENADVIYAWYKFMASVQRPSNPQPVVILSLRNFGYVGVGVYEAVHPGIKGSVSLSTKLYQMPKMPQVMKGENYSWSASANAALASMFKLFLAGLSDVDKASIDSMENATKEKLSKWVPDDVIDRSEDFGRAIAQAIFDWSVSDNFNLGSQGYVLPQFPGSWVPTAPSFATFGPFLKDSRPFLHANLASIAPPLPFPYSEEKDSEFYAAAKEVYDIGNSLTDEQKATAVWWADFGGPGVGLPAPYHFLSIVTWVAESEGAKLAQAAEIYAKTGIAMKDGPIATFRGKYHYSLLRPITYINQQIDGNWNSYLPNPPYPEYPSGLVGVCGPVMQVLIREFGDIPVTDDAYDWKGIPARHYSSISKMREEAALSRLYAGIHYKFTQYATIEAAKEMGDVIADINIYSNSGK
jgi:hypothetical protein